MSLKLEVAKLIKANKPRGEPLMKTCDLCRENVDELVTLQEAYQGSTGAEEVCPECEKQLNKVKSNVIMKQKEVTAQLIRDALRQCAQEIREELEEHP